MGTKLVAVFMKIIRKFRDEELLYDADGVWKPTVKLNDLMPYDFISNPALDTLFRSEKTMSRSVSMNCKFRLLHPNGKKLMLRRDFSLGTEKSAEGNQ